MEYAYLGSMHTSPGEGLSITHRARGAKISSSGFMLRLKKTSTILWLCDCKTPFSLILKANLLPGFDAPADFDKCDEADDYAQPTEPVPCVC